MSELRRRKVNSATVRTTGGTEIEILVYEYDDPAVGAPLIRLLATRPLVVHALYPQRDKQWEVNLELEVVEGPEVRP